MNTNIKIANIRLEVMNLLEKKVTGFIDKYLMPIDTIWQPSDFLPDSRSANFITEVVEMQEAAKELDYDFWVVLVGDTVTEEALPTYESWLTSMDGVGLGENENGWGKWLQNWTAEENRHGDLLNKYLYLSGRVNMREVEVTTQYLLSDGFDPGTGKDPYKNFVYTSFQELATNISHRRVAKLAKEKGNLLLSKMCGNIAADEMRHHKAYSAFVQEILKYDPSEMLLAFSDMMKRKIVMPAHLIRESGFNANNCYTHFSEVAQRLGVYTAQDYVEILQKLTIDWDIEKLTDLNDSAEKARDYLMKLPERLTRISERMTISTAKHQFKWVQPV